MTGSPTSPSRLERNCPPPPGTSSKNGQDSQPPPHPADIRARQPPGFTTTTTCTREFLPHPWPTVPPATPASASPTYPRRSPHTKFWANRRDQPVCSDSRSVGRIPAEEA